MSGGDEVSVEWHRAGAFAEYAEALGCDTRDILAAWSNVAGTAALFTRDSSNPLAEIFEARFERDAESILRAVSVSGTGLTVKAMMRRRRL